METKRDAPGAGDRRPIAAREHAASAAVAAWLIRRGASPNGISLAGMGCGLLAGLAFALTWSWPEAARGLWLLGAVLVQLRLAANMFDGMVAVGRGIASPRGELWNEVPDRVSDTAVLVGLGVAAGGDWALGLGAALAAMATAYVRCVGRAAGAPSDFSGPMAKQQRMFLATAVALVCALAPAAWSAGLPRAALVVILLGSLLTAALRLRRAARALAR
jgi:phosphatidylglycerophosphate synthase